MKTRNLFAVAAAFGAFVIEAAAQAGLPLGVPEPEVGFGIAAAVVVGAGYTWLKGRINR